MLIKALPTDHKQTLETAFAERSRVPASGIWFAGSWKRLHVLLSSLFLQPVSKSQMTRVKWVSEACVPPVYEPCWKPAFQKEGSPSNAWVSVSRYLEFPLSESKRKVFDLPWL